MDDRNNITRGRRRKVRIFMDWSSPQKLVFEIGGWLKRSHGNLELLR